MRVKGVRAGFGVATFLPWARLGGSASCFPSGVLLEGCFPVARAGFDFRVSGDSERRCVQRCLDGASGHVAGRERRAVRIFLRRIFRSFARRERKARRPFRPFVRAGAVGDGGIDLDASAASHARHTAGPHCIVFAFVRAAVKARSRSISVPALLLH